ncbi:hypothetical protein ACWGJB_36225 [Streptomyces sp. NPDC054813]
MERQAMPIALVSHCLLNQNAKVSDGAIRHADIRAVAGLPETFVSSKGLFLNDVKCQAQAGDELITDSFFPKGGDLQPPEEADVRARRPRSPSSRRT